MEQKDVVIIGGGPAGLAAAVELHKQGIRNMIILEREAMLGGILLSIHNLHYLIDLMRRAREAVLADAYEEFYQEWMASPAAKDY